MALSEFLTILGPVLMALAVTAFFYTPDFLTADITDLTNRMNLDFQSICAGEKDNLARKIRKFLNEYYYVINYKSYRSKLSIGLFFLGFFCLLIGCFMDTILDKLGGLITTFVIIFVCVLTSFLWLYPGIKGIYNITNS